MHKNRAPADVLEHADRHRNLYRCVCHHLDEFVCQFRWALNSRAGWLREQRVRPDTWVQLL